MAAAHWESKPTVDKPLAGLSREAAVVRMELLERLASTLATASSVDDVTRAILDHAASLPEVVRGGLALIIGGGRELRFSAMHEDDLAGRVAWCTLDASADLPIVRSARTGRKLWFSTIEDLAAQFPGLALHQRKFGVEGFACLPMRAGDKVLGALMLGYATQQPFTEVEQAFLAAFVSQSAHALNQARAWDQQRDLAELLQYSLLPDITPDLPGLAVAARYEPSLGGLDVGGDWFDVIPLSDGSVVLVIGDVMGRGIDAATFMGQVRTALRAYALIESGPDALLARLDDFMRSFDLPEQIVTVLVAVIDQARSTIRLATAGHPPPIHAPAGEQARVADVNIGPPLGLTGGDRPVLTLPLRTDDLLVFFTDGLVENVLRPIGEGIELLRSAVDSEVARTRVPRDLCTRLSATMSSPATEDDQALVVLASTVGRKSRVASTDLPGDARAAGLARRWLERLLLDWGLEGDVVDEAVLCLSEVVTNAIIHTATAPRVRATFDDETLLVAVHDAGRRGRAHLLLADPEEVGGRGLAVVDAIADAWSAERRADGTTLWFQFAVSP